MLCPICTQTARVPPVPCRCEADPGHVGCGSDATRAHDDRYAACLLLLLVALFAGAFALKAQASDSGLAWTLLKLIGIGEFWAAISLYRDARRTIAITLARRQLPPARVVRHGRSRW